MKILTLTLIISVSFTAMGQIPVHCNKIEIYNTLKAEENYKLSGRLLIDHGWGIACASGDFFTVTTNEVSLGTTHAYYNIASRDSVILIYGMVKIPPADASNLGRIVPVENTKGWLSLRGEAFDKMLEISNYFTGTKKYTADIDKSR
jgi:hypothetical protein